MPNECTTAVKRFIDRFAKFGLSEKVIRPSYGLAEATLYVASPPISDTVRTARFDLQQLAAGVAERCDAGQESSTELVSYGPPQAYPVRIVDPETGLEQPAGTIGEIWTRGDNVALGYWRKPEQTTLVFRARINEPSEGPRPDRGCAPVTSERSRMGSSSSWAGSRTC